MDADFRAVAAGRGQRRAEAAATVDGASGDSQGDTGDHTRCDAGISSRGYRPGPYSNREDLLYAFDRFIVDTLEHAAKDPRVRADKIGQ